MTKQATQKKGAATSAAPKRTPNPRDALIAAIAAKRQAGYKASTEEAIATGLTAKEELEGEPEADADAELDGSVESESLEGQAQDGSQDTDVSTEQEGDGTDAVDSDTPAEPELPAALKDKLVLEDGKVKVRLKVDGKVQLLELDSLTQDAQKYLAGDARLREAAEAKRRNDQTLQQLQAQEAQLKQRQQQPPATAGADDKELDDEAAEFANLVLTGTKEEVAAATKKILKKAARPTAAPVDEDAIVRKTRAQLAQEAYDASLVRGFDRFQKEFKDVFEDDDLRAAADARTDRISNEHPDWAPEQVILEAAKQIREKEQAKLKGLTAKPGTKPLANRQERKDNLRQIPTQRSAKNETPKAPVPKTRAQIVAEMKRARGQG